MTPLIGEIPVEDALVHTIYGDVLPLTRFWRAGMELDVRPTAGSSSRNDALDRLSDRYDFLFLTARPP